MQSFCRLYHTVRPLTPGQWYARGRWIVARQAYRRLGSLTTARLRAAARPIAKAGVNEGLLRPCAPSDLLAREDWEVIRAKADAACESRFTFLSETAMVTPGRCWSDQTLSQLWRYQLHYFGYAVSLGATYRVSGEERYYGAFRSLVSDWVRSNPPGVGDGWHPYTVSLRAVHWMMAYHLFSDRLEEDTAFRAELLVSLAAQMVYLRRHLEFDVGGNHLLENLRALVWAGAFFRSASASRWGVDARRMLERELVVQVLPDGGHYERTPMYHGIVLWDLMEMIAVCRNAGDPLPESVERAAQSMAAWLGGVLHPDGEIPLFNDAVFGETPTPGALGAFEAALWPDRPTALPQGMPDLKQILLIGDSLARPKRANVPDTADYSDSGYHTFGTRAGSGGWAVFDAGDPCPAALPAHAHCDLLSYELSVGAQRFVVDTGVYEYAKGPWRDYVRGTRAHNTVAIDGAEQSEVWDSFRVAGRARPQNVRIVRKGNVEGIVAAHDGFARLAPGLVHTRLFACVNSKIWFVLDWVDAKDRATPRRIESFVHWHPSVAVRQDGEYWRAEGERESMTCLPFGWDEASLHTGEEDPPQGWYCPEFGAKAPNAVLTLSAKAALPFLAGYVLAPGAEPVRVDRNGSQWTAAVDGAAHTLDMDLFGFPLLD